MTETKTEMFFGIPGAPFELHFGSISEALGALSGPLGGLGEVLEGSENEVEKRDPPNSCR